MKAIPMNTSHIQDVVNLEQEIWAEEAATIEMIESRYTVFPEGSVVVVDEGKVVGYVAVQKVSRMSCQSWHKQTDNGYIRSTHCDSGHIIYGIGMSGNKNGVADLVISYVYDKFISSGECYLIALGSRLPGFSSWARKHGKNIEKYIKLRRANGNSFDPELCLYQKHGFEVICEIKDYFPCEDSLNYGALIVKR